MSTSGRKPGDKPLDALSPDDPSIPVLTERLTLPPLDLDLDFRLPPRPGLPTPQAPVAPEARPMPFDDNATRYMPRGLEQDFAADDATRLANDRSPAFEPAALAPPEAPPAPAPEPAAAPASLGPDTRGGPDTLNGPDTRGGPDTRNGPDTRSNPITRGGPTTRSGPPSRFGSDTPPGADSGRETSHAGAESFTQMATRLEIDLNLGETRFGTQAKADTIAPPAPASAEAPPASVAPQPEPVPEPVESPEPVDEGPRVPTSLLVTNLDLPAIPARTHRRPQPDDFDLTVTDGGQGAANLDEELRERILLDLARRLPSDVDTIVRRHLETAIDEAVRRFAAEVRIALAGSLREIVDRAVKSELDRLKSRR